MLQNCFVKTISEHCRVCYTCVRECPAKAIRIADGQAEIVPERCIGCGNCVRVCSQHAKQVISSTDEARAILAGEAPVAAILAPSFPAEFPDIPWDVLVGMLRAMGFRWVNEVAFGADLVAKSYRTLLAQNDGRRYIATSCPAIVAFVERYQPQLVEHLAPIVSPMVAEARVLKRLHGDDIKVMFLGPCIAKKGEAASELLPGEVDLSLTFAELREMWAEMGVTPAGAAPGDFDLPHAGAGALFPISRGLLQAADIQEDLITGEVVTAAGKEFLDAIKGFDSEDFDARLLEVLCCQGCIMGAGMTCDDSRHSRRSRVSQFARERLDNADTEAWHAAMRRFDDLDMGRSYQAQDQRLQAPYQQRIVEVLARMGKFKPEDELNCGACGYDTCREHAVAILKGLAESEMCLPYTIEQLRSTVEQLNLSHEQLASTQAALMQSEKLASMGQLAAGIAHEVNNPLGVVLVYAHLLLDEYRRHPAMRQDLEMIVKQADRCKKIVAGLLHFARQNKVVLETVSVPELVDQALRAVTRPERIELDVRHEAPDLSADLDGDQIMQVLTNLVSNAYAAMPNGGTLTVSTRQADGQVMIAVADTGIGIADENRKKIFEPFFTTKQIGQGTGLGLAMAYGIIKMHSGDIAVESNADTTAGPTGTTFTLTLPRHATRNGGTASPGGEPTRPDRPASRKP